MVNYVEIKNSVVSNIVVSSSEVALERGWVIAGLAKVGDTWDGTDFTTPEVDPTPEAEVDPVAAREAMQPITLLQAMLAIGETDWATVIAFRDGKDEDGEALATWQDRVTIDNALTWDRLSDTTAFFATLLDYDDEAMDAVFTTAGATNP